MNRNGEKIGWIGGWIGSFLWLLALSVLWFFRGQIQLGEIAIGLFIRRNRCEFSYSMAIS
jgi:hypothetical protein